MSCVQSSVYFTALKLLEQKDGGCLKTQHINGTQFSQVELMHTFKWKSLNNYFWCSVEETFRLSKSRVLEVGYSESGANCDVILSNSKKPQM